jgi:small subunit ribosomal protein S4
MSRYTGPRLRIVRRLGTELPGLTTKTATRRPYAPGQAAAVSRRAPKVSEFGLRLREKQKLRYHYGLTERALRKIYVQANRMPGDTGRNMLTLLEARFDNLVWRAGLTRTIPAARQLITHGHVDIGKRRAKTPSQLLKKGAVFTVREAARNREDLRISVNSPISERPTGLNVDLDKLAVTVDALPQPEQCPLDVDIQKVIEYFAK